MANRTQTRLLDTASLVVEVADRDGNIGRKAFRGRWLVSLTASSEKRFSAGVEWAVAETERARMVVVTAPRGYVGERLDSFKVFASLDSLQSCDRVPKDIKSMVRAELGDSYVQELDI